MADKSAKAQLDFIVIGAAKAGTTPLYEFIKDHPQINIPSGKELAFFSNEKVYKKGYGWYIKQVDKNRKPNSLLGTMTPQYMLGQLDTPPETVAKRIKKHCPDVKLVAVLRNPIDRAYSQYKMAYRRGYEKKSFEKSMRDLVRNRKKIKTISPTNQAILGSEYGRSLSKYFELFDKKNIHIIFSEDLKDNPEKELNKLFKFLSIDFVFKPKGSDKVVHKGGFKPKVKFLTPSFLYSIPGVKYVWNNLIPYTLRKRVDFAINSWNVKPDKNDVGKDSDLYKFLVDYFKSDVYELEKLIGVKVSWQGFHK